MEDIDDIANGDSDDIPHDMRAFRSAVPTGTTPADFGNLTKSLKPYEGRSVAKQATTSWIPHEASWSVER